MVEGLLRRALDDRGVEATISSSGFLLDGDPATGDAVAVMRLRDIDIAPHRSRTTTAEMLEQADLVVAMARVHIRQAGVLVPSAFPRLLTLKELVRRGEQVGPRHADESLDEWLARVGEGRDMNHLLGDSPDDDVADPVGKSYRTYKKTAKELDDLVTRLVGLVWP
jgi:protein-tyrosine phosphatase